MAPVDRVKIPSSDPRLKSRIEVHDWSALDWIGGYYRALGSPSKGLNFCHNYRPPPPFDRSSPLFSFIYRICERFVSNPRHDLNAAAAFSVAENKSKLEFKFNYGSMAETDIRVFSSGGRISCRIFLAFLKRCSKIRFFFLKKVSFWKYLFLESWWWWFFSKMVFLNIFYIFLILFLSDIYVYIMCVYLDTSLFFCVVSFFSFFFFELLITKISSF